MSAWPTHPIARRSTPVRPLARQVYRCDFRDLATTSDFGASTQEIRGVTWTVANHASASTFRVTNGSGIQIAPDENTEFTFNPTAPYLEVALTDLIGDFERLDTLFVEWVVASAGLAEDGQAYGVMAGSGTTANKSSVGMLETVFDSGLKVRTTKLFGTQNSEDVAAPNGNEPRLLGLEYRCSMAAALTSEHGGFARASALTRPTYAFPTSFPIPSSSDGAYSPTTDVVRIWAERPTGAAAFTATFQQLRISRLPWMRT